MRHYLLLPICIFLLASCKGKDDAQPSNPDTVAKVAGTYTGLTKHKYRVDAGSSGIHSDSTTVADTFVVTAIGADSFLLTRPVWDIAQPGFRYNGSAAQYARQRGTTAFNDHLDEIAISFDTAAHKLSITKHHVSISSWIMEDWDSCTGTK